MYFWPARLASRAQSRAALGLGLKCLLGEELVLGHGDALHLHGPLVLADDGCKGPSG
jgi:hypothetical protein